MLCVLSQVQFFSTLRTVAPQAPLSLRFPRLEYWSGLPFPSPGDLPDPGMEPASPTMAGRYLTTEPPGKPRVLVLQFSSVTQSCPTLCDPMDPQHSRPPCPSPTSRVYPNSCPLSRWCQPNISSSVVPFSSHLQSFPATGSFQMSQFFTSGVQHIGASASTSVHGYFKMCCCVPLTSYSALFLLMCVCSSPRAMSLPLTVSSEITGALKTEETRVSERSKRHSNL